MAVLTTKARKAIPAKKFANPEKRRFPLEDDTHIRNARAREKYASPAERKRIDAAARSHGIGTLGKKKKR